EAAHGMLALSPRAVERLESYSPPWPMPKVFRLTKNGKLNGSIFEGSTINTPSMLCVEDALDSLRWAESLGGFDGLRARTQANLDAVARWVASSEWADFLCAEPENRSSTSICLKIVDPWAANRDDAEVAKTIKAAAKRLDEEGVAFDIGSYRDAPTGLRLWGGATVDTADLEALFPWLDWAWTEAKQG
ncbi:MAG: phosphoserine aminotransferase, partial [Myxococcota bacterium]